MSPLKESIHEILFEADTQAGKIVDIGLMVLIILSVIAVMLESVNSIAINYEEFFFVLEIVFTIIFTIEYFLRIYALQKPWRYITSFYGIVDLMAVLPTYLMWLLPVYQTKYLIVIRALRLLRIFRVLKLAKFLSEGKVIIAAMRASLAKITVFLVFVILLVLIFGSLLYVVESNQDSGFSSIPRSVYWAIVTITTVGYGDIAPQSPFGQLLAAMIMLLGYAVIAVPTGIVTMELTNANKNKDLNTQACKSCGRDGHDDDADFCKFCGGEIT